MKYTTLIYLSFTFLSLDSWGQSDLYRSKGFYNITKVSTGIFTKVDEQNQIGASSSYNNSYVFAMNSSLGLHLGTFGVSQLGLNPARRPRRSAVMGLEAGIGMVRYYQPSLTVIPTSLGLKIFFSRIDNSLYLAAGGHGSIGKGNFKDSQGFNIGMGYKFFLFDSQCFIIELLYEQRFINMIEGRAVTQSEHIFSINHLSLSIGIMPF
jgi:hypothetical protein